MKNTSWTEHEVEQVIGRLLQIGVLLASVTVAIGGALLLMREGGAIPHFAHYSAEPARLNNLRSIAQGAFQLRSRAFIQFGVLLLIATPIARVALTLFAFLFQRDWLYVVMTAIVLGLLLSSLL